MFSFFRRSKKDSDSNKEKKNNNVDSAESTPTLDRKEMCKNNLTTQKDDSVLQGNTVTSLPNLPSEFGLRENPTNAACSEVTALHEKNDSNMNSSTKNVTTSDTTKCSSPMIYAMDQPAPPVRRGSCVKPCGHGTTAIMPRVPVINTKRDTGSTPPSSPKLELDKKLNNKQGAADQDEKNVKDTVTASLKLHVTLPANITPSAAALVESISPMLNGTDNSDKKNLINQEAKFQSQLNDLSKQLSIRDAETNKLRFQMDELQRDVFSKSAGMDRLQAELQAAHKESEIVRQRIKHLESDLINYKERSMKLSAELKEKSEYCESYEDETNAKITELEAIIKRLKVRIEFLEEELETLRKEKEKLEEKHAVLVSEREEEKKKVADTLEQTLAQKQEIEKKWKEDFEKLRTINIMKEQQLLDDFEWKLREVQQTCKKRLEEKDKTIEERLQKAYEEAEKKMKQAEDMMAQVEAMKSFELEIKELKGLTEEQDKSLKEMIEKQEQMKDAEDSLKAETKRLRNLIEMEKENMQHIQRLHHQEIVDKERTLKQTLREKRTEVAMYWEERLLHECGRLKSELEQIHSEEKHYSMEQVRNEKDEEFERAKREWENKIKECLKEITSLKRALLEKDEYYREEIVGMQTNTDRDLLELRRLMDKIDMSHHDRFEKLVQKHETEIERINEETEQRIKEIETSCHNQVTSLTANLEQFREQMEQESQQKIEALIEQHRSDLDNQWDNLIRQKSDAVLLVEDEYVTKYKMLEEHFHTQQKSHEAREIELLKTIDSLTNELNSKDSSMDDLQNNVDTLEGGIQVLNQEIAQQNDQLMRTKREADQKVRGLQESLAKVQDQQEKEREQFRLKLMAVQKQYQETIDHQQRKCQCLTKLFEEVRLRYERRESRQEDLNIISDLRQVIAEQEKDLACLNEEKRYFQMRLITMENRSEDNASGDEDAFEDAQQSRINDCAEPPPSYPPNGLPPAYPVFTGPVSFSIPPTIPECDE